MTHLENESLLLPETRWSFLSQFQWADRKFEKRQYSAIKSVEHSKIEKSWNRGSQHEASTSSEIAPRMEHTEGRRVLHTRDLDKCSYIASTPAQAESGRSSPWAWLCSPGRIDPFAVSSIGLLRGPLKQDSRVIAKWRHEQKNAESLENLQDIFRP